MNAMRLVAACGLFLGVSSGLCGRVDPPARGDAPLTPPSVRSLAYSPDGTVTLSVSDPPPPSRLERHPRIQVGTYRIEGNVLLSASQIYSLLRSQTDGTFRPLTQPAGLAR